MDFSQHPIEVFCCQNKDCKQFGLRNGGNLRFSGWSGVGKKIRMILCTTCGFRFSERRGTPLFESRLSEKVALSLLDHLREGCGTRTTSRLLAVSKDTVTRYAKLSGEHAQDVHNELVSFSPSNQRSSARRKVVVRRQKRKDSGPQQPGRRGKG